MFQDMGNIQLAIAGPTEAGTGSAVDQDAFLRATCQEVLSKSTNKG